MVQIASLNGISDNPPAPIVLTQRKFDRGVITVIDQSDLPKNALREAVNNFLAEDGAPTLRPGVDWYGTNPSANSIDGAEMYVHSDDTSHLIIVAGGSVYFSTNNGLTWGVCTGGSLTPGKKVHFETAGNYLYIFNGYDNIIRYNGTSTLAVYTSLSAPSGNVPTKTGLAGTAIYTLRYRVSAVNDIGYTQASVAQTTTVDRTRDTFDASNFVTFTWSAVVGAVRYDIYVGEVAGEETYIGSVEGQSTTTYQDKGAPQQISSVAPDSNTTQGPRVGQMTLVGSRLYATLDRDYPYRVWISGAGRYIGYFSSAYDATYIDLQKGSIFKPVNVEDYRDGKGTPLATVWCKSKDGRGCIWQGSLDSFTVGDVTFPVPNFYKLPGSRGTEAPDSVVNVLNDYYYYNSQAIYNLGSRAQYLNLLSTDEVSANIRPNVRNIRKSAASGIAGHFDGARLYMSVPVNSDTNNVTMVYDISIKAKPWLPEAFNIGFERFFNYTDTDGNYHLLAWKTGDTKLTEISENIRGDYGVAFSSSFTTGLNHVNPKNRFEFMWAEEGEIEFAQQRGPLTIELSGITREDGYKVIKEKVVAPERTKHSWTTSPWGGDPWTNTDAQIYSYSEPSKKRYFSTDGVDINAYQYRVSTNSLDAGYIARTLQINGTATQAGKPTEWELFD